MNDTVTLPTFDPAVLHDGRLALGQIARITRGLAALDTALARAETLAGLIEAGEARVAALGTQAADQKLAIEQRAAAARDEAAATMKAVVDHFAGVKAEAEAHLAQARDQAGAVLASAHHEAAGIVATAQLHPAHAELAAKQAEVVSLSGEIDAAVGHLAGWREKGRAAQAEHELLSAAIADLKAKF